MAAIDKIYVNTQEEYLKFKEWCKEQPSILDKYGKYAKLTDFLIHWKNWDKGSHPIFMAPYYVDAYLIRNCPFEFIQKGLMLNYGHWSQERIKEYYEDVKNWDTSTKGECPYWAKLDSFITLEDGTMTIKGLEESDYSKIKKGELYTSPFTNCHYTVGKHFRCRKYPSHMYNTPYDCENWFINVDVPDGLPFLWYHEKYNSWDFCDEFVLSSWSSNTAFCKTIRALKRLMIKWKLPIGTIVRATGRYTFDNYEFIITK